jgi:hypothetical protein
MEDSKFFSHYASGAQRLPNGNTLIAETSYGRILEVTRDNEIVWEYVSPYSTSEKVHSSRMFRAYRVPYEWIPQLAKPEEKAIVPPKNADFKVSGEP